MGIAHHITTTLDIVLGINASGNFFPHLTHESCITLLFHCFILFFGWFSFKARELQIQYQKSHYKLL